MYEQEVAKEFCTSEEIEKLVYHNCIDNSPPFTLVIYEMSAGRDFSRMSALVEARATKERVLHLRECSYNIF
jgi:hypothetical protein